MKPTSHFILPEVIMITLKNLHRATKQQIFEQVATHLLKQNAKSMNGLFCAYRGDDGLSCAAGCLVADDEYNEEFEEIEWQSLVKEFDLPKRNDDLIQALQHIHDKVDVENWKEALKELAKSRRLKSIFMNEI